MKEDRKFIQVIVGPRQVGKSTVVKQVLQELGMPFQAFSADIVPTSNNGWISNCWDAVRSLNRSKGYESIGLNKFRELFNPHRAFIVGSGGMLVEDFLSIDTLSLFK